MSNELTDAEKAAAEKALAEKKAAAKKTKPKLVKMGRDEKIADVHPDEVENFSRYGWQKV